MEGRATVGGTVECGRPAPSRSSFIRRRGMEMVPNLPECSGEKRSECGRGSSTHWLQERL